MTFDIYKTYIKPNATPKQLIFVSHAMICFFGLVMAAFACIWQAIGIDLGWLFLTMGLIIGGAVFPAAFALCWKGQTKLGAIAGCLLGLGAGLSAWLAQAYTQYGELTIATTGAAYPTLAGNMAAVLTGLIVSFSVSIIKPDKFDFNITRAINAASPVPTPSPTSGDEMPPKGEKEVELPIAQEEDLEMLEDEKVIRDPKSLQSTFWFALILSSILSFTMDFLIPMPMFFTHYVFSKGFFLGWVIISFLWVFFALFTCGILPILETRNFWKLLFKEIFARKR